ncbi:MAG: hypothetical protein NHG36_02210 [Chromatiaceae bacterium]|nr:hypothetical protein [Candidatus Thioaporhodococcus sediminis]
MTEGHPLHELIQLVFDTPVFEYQGPRKIVTCLTWTPERLPDPPDLTLLGYDPRTKMRNLARTYLNHVDIDRVKRQLQKRARQQFTSLACSMRGEEKPEWSMGHCMQNAIVGVTRNRRVVTMQYRSTEVLQKFAADLAFLPVLFEALELEPQQVTFQFAYAYLSMVFVPSAFNYLEPIPFLEYLKQREPHLFRIAVRYLSRAFRPNAEPMPYSPWERQRKLAHRMYPEKIPEIFEYLLTQREDGRYA